MSDVNATVVDASPHVLYSLWQHAFITGAHQTRVIEANVDGEKNRVWIRWELVGGQHFGMKYLTMSFEVQKKFCFSVRFGGTVEIDKTQMYRPSYDDPANEKFTPNFEDFWFHSLTVVNNFPAEDIDHYLMMAAMNLPPEKRAE